MRRYNEILITREPKLKIKNDKRTLLLYILFLYISLPVAPRIWNKLAKYSVNFPDYLSVIAFVICGIAIGFYLLFQKKSIPAFIWLIILAVTYGYCLREIEFPAEKIHFLEYGLLSFFVFRAFRHNIKNGLIYLWSGITVFTLGFIDEGIQYFLPNRVYDTGDVFINGLAGVLGLLLIGLCFRPALKNME